MTSADLFKRIVLCGTLRSFRHSKMKWNAIVRQLTQKSRQEEEKTILWVYAQYTDGKECLVQINVHLNEAKDGVDMKECCVSVLHGNYCILLTFASDNNHPWL